MNPLNNNYNNEGSLPPPPRGAQLEEGATGVCASMDVNVYNQSPFLRLPYETKSLIIRYLGFREITRLAKVCRYFHDLVRQNAGSATFLSTLVFVFLINGELRYASLFNSSIEMGLCICFVIQRASAGYPLQALR
ncbi:F-box protein [Endozoicomonas sp. 8E]|uniref:F-box protein n=1 Tax=Endozoicomonas sp. 8E TaxID=3035692 RepID=UPI00293903C5|nr:F-box protein [Endozoicomonas sp. 8E]WOG28289.1 F-box protein [Endozoicomonas sp. 8E]